MNQFNYIKAKKMLDKVNMSDITDLIDKILYINYCEYSRFMKKKDALGKLGITRYKMETIMKRLNLKSPYISKSSIKVIKDNHVSNLIKENQAGNCKNNITTEDYIAYVASNM
jgi:hypothetical protein